MSSEKGQLAWPIFAKIAPHEFLVASLARPSSSSSSGPSAGRRPNGRHADEARPLDVHTGSLAQAHGSAAVRLGRTRVICGVRGEILPVASIPQYRPSSVASPNEDGDAADAASDAADAAAAVDADNRRQLRDYDLLVPNLELATGSAPEFLPGGPPSVLAQVLSTRLYALLHSSGLVDAEALKIWHRPERRPRASDGGGGAMEVDDDDDDDDDDENDDGEDPARPEVKAYWTLYIDLLFLSFDGNPFDAAWAAVVAALKDTRLPAARWDADRERVVCSSSASAAPQPLVLRGLPAAATFAVCVENKKKQQRQSRDAAGTHWILHDPDRLEEGQCRETVTVVVDCTVSAAGSAASGSTTAAPPVVRALAKSGGTLVGPAELRALVAVAATRWAALAKALGPGA